MSKLGKTFQFMLFIGAAFAATLQFAHAASFNSLIQDGFKAGGLSSNKAGVQGWVLKKGKDAYFCKMNVSLVYVGKNGMASLTSNGRMIKLDKKTYLDSVNMEHDDTIPHLEDLKAGRPRPEDVGSCAPVR